jgi:hypothetical protein
MKWCNLIATDVSEGNTISVFSTEMLNQKDGNSMFLWNIGKIVTKWPHGSEYRSLKSWYVFFEVGNVLNEFQTWKVFIKSWVIYAWSLWRVWAIVKVSVPTAQ